MCDRWTQKIVTLDPGGVTGDPGGVTLDPQGVTGPRRSDTPAPWVLSAVHLVISHSHVSSPVRQRSRHEVDTTSLQSTYVTIERSVLVILSIIVKILIVH